MLPHQKDLADSETLPKQDPSNLLVNRSLARHGIIEYVIIYAQPDELRSTGASLLTN